jgi:protein-S-isoprenylcysteine O-methyltransferase Ste14
MIAHAGSAAPDRPAAAARGTGPADTIQSGRMQGYVYGLLFAGWLVWTLPFFLVKLGGPRTAQIDRRARWGIIIQAVSYSILWQNAFWTRQPGPWRLTAGTLFMVLAGVLSWTSARTLGRHWRVDAGLNADHQLVRSGAYRFVRHPIYTSMLCMLLGTGFLITPLLLLAAATVVFMVGTEIRVRIEDSLLAVRFGDEFRSYKQCVAAYVPFVK